MAKTKVERQRLGALLRRVHAARAFPTNTCAASRHVQIMGEQLAAGQPYPMLQEEPVHCAESLLAVVAALYEARTQLAKVPPSDSEGSACRKCGGAMVRGKAIPNAYTASDEGTVNQAAHTGAAPLVDCMKCSACGWSVTEDVAAVSRPMSADEFLRDALAELPPGSPVAARIRAHLAGVTVGEVKHGG